MAPDRNRQVRLISRPSGIPQASDFAIVDGEVTAPEANQIVVRNEFVSVDPAMRGWVSSEANYASPVPIGAVMRATAVGTVLASRARDVEVADVVVGSFGWQEVATVDASAVHRILDERVQPRSLALGVLGRTGLTAWFGITSVAVPQPGETVVVSTAAGAVGSIAGQVAKLMGCRTVAIAGGAEKSRICREVFGYDVALDYRADTFQADLADVCADGVDVYFDNTSGAISDAVMRHLSVHARIAVCGTASVPTWDPWPIGPRLARTLLIKRATMRGFLVSDFEDRFDDGLARLTPLVQRRSIRYVEDVLDGLERAPDAIAGLYRGENVGKRVIRVHPTEENGS